MGVFKKLEKLRSKKLKSKRSDSALAAEESVSDSDQESDQETNAAAVTAAATPAASASSGVEIVLTEPSKWVERMTLTATKPLPSGLSANDDPKREEVFIQHGLLSAVRGLRLLEEANVPWARPADYYAEMYKSDVHMERIRESIVSSKQRVQERAKRRIEKDQKKFGKQVQAEVLRQRAKHKKDLMERVSDWRRKRKGERVDLNDVIDNIAEGTPAYAGGADKKGEKKGRRDHFLSKKKNLKPGGAKKRPGKNRRH